VPLYPTSDPQDDDNPLLSLLDSDEEDTSTISFIPGLDDEDEDKSGKKAAVNADSSALTERLDRLERENEQLKSRVPAVPQPIQYAPVPVPQYSSGLFPSNSNQDAAAAEVNRLNEAFARNPGEALREVYLRGQQAAEEAQKRNLVPVAIQNARFAINQFVTASGMDAETRAEFNKLVGEFTPEQLAQADPTRIEGQLDYVRKIARANVIEEKEKANKRSQNPPPLGSSSGSAGKGSPVSVKLNRQQKATWDLGKAQGLSDKDLYKMYKEGELD
jgi:hypothetical protein